MHFLFVLMLAALPAILKAQLNCSSIGFSDVVAPSPGTGLSRCVTSEEQCCTEDYIVSVQSRVQMALRQGLVDEFDDVIDRYQDGVENLLKYFRGEFLQRLIDRLPLAGRIDRSDRELNETLQELSNSYNIRDDQDSDEDDENTRLADRLAVSLINATVRALANGDREREMCVRRIAILLRNGDAVSTVADLIQTIRRSISTLIRIRDFLRNRRVALAEANFLERCISRFIDIAFCSRCRQKTPPLCFNACNALLRACYSPYYTALNEQYARLWDTVKRVVKITLATVQSFFNEEASLLDSDRFVEQVKQTCRADVPDDSDDGGPSDDEESDGVPERVVENILKLTGALAYKREGLRLCLSSLSRTNDCTRSNRTLQYCNETEICTARCRCTAGNGPRDTDIEEFMLNGVEDQVNNPVLPISEDVLNAQVAELNADDPVAAFLQSSEFTSVAPEGAEGGEEGDDSAAGSGVLSLTLFLVALLLAFV